MKTIIIAIFLTGITVSGVCQFSPDKENLSIIVMSYNVRYNTPKDSVNAWPYRKEKVASVITGNDVDIAGLQEPWMDQIRDLKKLLPEYAWIGWSRDNGKRKGEFTPVFYKKSKFKVLDKGVFWLSDTPDKPGSKGWDVRYPRTVVWVKFKEKSTGKELYFFNTHLDGEKARYESVKMIRSRIDDMAGELPVIITGDYNARPDSDAYRMMISTGTYNINISDAFDIAQDKNDEQLTDYWFDGSNTDVKRIDYIFVSTRIRVLYHEIINQRMGKYYPSDHLPVKAVLELK